MSMSQHLQSRTFIFLFIASGLWAHPMGTLIAKMWNIRQRPVLLKMLWEFPGFLAKQQKQRQTKLAHQRETRMGLVGSGTQILKKF